MKKLFSSLVVASTVVTLAACAKKATTTDTKTATTEKTKPEVKKSLVTKGSIAKGSFKIGYAGWNTDFTKNLKDTITTYTQDVTTKSQTGDEYFKLPSGLSLLSSDNFNSYLKPKEDIEYNNQVAKLKKYLLGHVRFGVDFLQYGYYAGNTYLKFTDVDNLAGPLTGAGYDKSNTGIIIILPAPIRGNAYAGAKATFDTIFSEEKIAKLYDVLKRIPGNKNTFRTALTEAGIQYSDADPDAFTSKADAAAVRSAAVGQGKAGTLYINTAVTANIIVSEVIKTVADLRTEFQTKTKAALSDKTKLAAKNLDALFVQVTDGVENSADVYKTVVEKKEFGATKLFFVGDKAKSKSGASSKVFAGGNVSTASFNKYASAYVAGFQAAVGTIKYSSSEDVYEETITSFLIGSTSDSEAKKKAFAFRRGVEAAAAHRAYSKYLKVKFVSKTEDSSKSSKKLYREVSEWKAREDSKSKLYEFSSSDTFSDADRRVIYLAGTTAKEWIGSSSDSTVDVTNHFTKTDDYGLIGALYNYKQASAQGESATALTTKTYARGVWVILDEATSGTAADDSVKIIASGALSQINTINEGQINFERHDVKFYGAIGDKVAGTKQFTKAALKGLYMGGANYMLGKHTIFGAQLNLEFVTKAYDGSASSFETDVWTRGADHTNTKQGVWTASNGKDSADKALERFKTSLFHAWEKEVTEAELIKASTWLK